MMWLPLLILLVASALPSSEAGKKLRKKNNIPCDCLDICFNIDTSGSIKDPDWVQIQKFICNFMGTFNNPPDDIHFCTIEFSRHANTVFRFDDPCNDDPTFGECKTIIENIVRQNKTTHHDRAMKVALEHFSVDPDLDGDRDDDNCPDVMILITDGRTHGGDDPVPIAQQVRDRGVAIFSIGIGSDIDVPVLTEFSGGDSDKVFLTSFEELPGVVNSLRPVVCENDEFDPYCQTCCCGTVYGDHRNQLPDLKSKCCGRTRWDPRRIRAVCCQGYFYEGYDTRWTRCCYTQPYDIRLYTCCYNEVVHATRSQDQCCGLIAFNQKHEICCNRQVFKRHINTQCCFTTAYDPTSEICCRYKVSAGSSTCFCCCGRQAYNPKKSTCANPFYSLVTNSPRIYCGKDLTLPCGNGVWDPLWNTCCNGVVYPGAVTHTTGCCRQERIDLTSQMCCDGVVVNADPEWYQCCGRQVYDPWSQTCCDGYYVVEGLGLCCGFYRLFDPSNQICCGGSYIFSGSPCSTKCCYHFFFGFRPYDTKHELCCLGNVQQGGRHWYCCGYYSYNIKTHMCCYGRIFPRRLFRMLGYCDLIFDEGLGPDPSEGVSADESRNEPEPSNEPIDPPEIQDDPENVNGPAPLPSE